tara:strand:- start:251 stop:508 length:258 start_codon:yes stop_codon:yes gene_type:complete
MSISLTPEFTSGCKVRGVVIVSDAAKLALSASKPALSACRDNAAICTATTACSKGATEARATEGVGAAELLGAVNRTVFVVAADA